MPPIRGRARLLSGSDLSGTEGNEQDKEDGARPTSRAGTSSRVARSRVAANNSSSTTLNGTRSNRTTPYTAGTRSLRPTTSRARSTTPAATDDQATSAPSLDPNLYTPESRAVVARRRAQEDADASVARRIAAAPPTVRGTSSTRGARGRGSATPSARVTRSMRQSTESDQSSGWLSGHRDIMISQMALAISSGVGASNSTRASITVSVSRRGRATTTTTTTSSRPRRGRAAAAAATTAGNQTTSRSANGAAVGELGNGRHPGRNSRTAELLRAINPSESSDEDDVDFDPDTFVELEDFADDQPSESGESVEDDTDGDRRRSSGNSLSAGMRLMIRNLVRHPRTYPGLSVLEALMEGEELSDGDGDDDDDEDSEAFDYDSDESEAQEVDLSDLKPTYEGTRTSNEFGSCLICMEDDVKDPHGCLWCQKSIGCFLCCWRWRRTKGPNHDKCPHCRGDWDERPLIVPSADLDRKEET